MWIIDFGVDMSMEQAAMYEAPFEYVAQIRPTGTSEGKSPEDTRR